MRLVEFCHNSLLLLHAFQKADLLMSPFAVSCVAYLGPRWGVAVVPASSSRLQPASQPAQPARLAGLAGLAVATPLELSWEPWEGSFGCGNTSCTQFGLRKKPVRAILAAEKRWASYCGCGKPLGGL